MTWEDLLQTILKIAPKDRKEKITIFDYHSNQWLNVNELEVCSESPCPIHLTIN